MAENKYQMSFSTGGLFFLESLTAVEVYFAEKDWEKVREKLLSENLIQSKMESSSKRRIREICQRLELLTEEQLKLLNTGSSQEQIALLWVAICKKYEFIKEFMLEVIREKFLRMDLLLQPYEYDIFFNHKEEWHEELEELTETTRAKLKQVLFKIMREAEVITKENMIIPGFLTEDLAQALAKDNPIWMSMLPVSDADINRWL